MSGERIWGNRDSNNAKHTLAIATGEATGDGFSAEPELPVTAACNNIFRLNFSEIAKVHYEIIINLYKMTIKEHRCNIV